MSDPRPGRADPKNYKYQLVHFRQCYRGVETEAFALVYLTNETIDSAVVSLLKFKEVANSYQPLIFDK